MVPSCVVGQPPASPEPSEQDCFVQPSLPWGQPALDHIVFAYEFVCVSKMGQVRGYALMLGPKGRAQLSPDGKHLPSQKQGRCIQTAWQEGSLACAALLMVPSVCSW